MSYYKINLAKIVQANEWSILTLAAMNLEKQSMFSIGSYFEKISDRDLANIISTIEYARIDKIALRDLTMLSIVLAMAEGSVTAPEDVKGTVNGLVNCAVFEFQGRKGLIELDRSLMTLGSNRPGELMAKLTDKGIEYATKNGSL